MERIKLESIQIPLSKELSWMIGFWLGDNWSSRKGIVVGRGKRSSGRFGVISNDDEVIRRFLSGMKSELKITKIKVDVQFPRNLKVDREQLKKETNTITITKILLFITSNLKGLKTKIHYFCCKSKNLF